MIYVAAGLLFVWIVACAVMPPMVTRCHLCFGTGTHEEETCPRCNGLGKWASSYLFRCFIAVDQLANALLNGDPDETISSRLHKMQEKGSRIGIVGCKMLDWIDPGHCPRTVERDEGQL